MRMITEFLRGIGSSYTPDEESVVKINNKRFLVDEKLRTLIVQKDSLVYAGRFLGKDKRDFHPSSILLTKLGAEKGFLNRIHVDRRTAWLFVCGRDIFEENILSHEGSLEEEAFSLVMFEEDCLGYGRVERFEGKKILKNLFDIGDFLRRER